MLSCVSDDPLTFTNPAVSSFIAVILIIMQPPHTKLVAWDALNPISSGRWYTSTAYDSSDARGGGISNGKPDNKHAMVI